MCQGEKPAYGAMNVGVTNIHSNVGNENKMAIGSQHVNEMCDVEKLFFPHFTYQVRQSASRYRLPPELNTPSWPWGRWSICSPDFAALRCHSTDRSSTWELKTTKHTFHGLVSYFLFVSCCCHFLFPAHLSSQCSVCALFPWFIPAVLSFSHFLIGLSFACHLLLPLWILLIKVSYFFSNLAASVCRHLGPISNCDSLFRHSLDTLWPPWCGYF